MPKVHADKMYLKFKKRAENDIGATRKAQNINGKTFVFEQWLFRQKMVLVQYAVYKNL